jgi:uncharacterized protein (TIGR02466 family)
VSKAGIETLFATSIYTGRIGRRELASLNPCLLRECRQLREDDLAGRRWSIKNYPGGFTSYQSANKMHRTSPNFARLERRLAAHVGKFARALQWNLGRRRLEMTDCWVNIMPRGTSHGLHLHPVSALSGTYYVQTPRGCPGLKFEDPRLDRFMAAPPRRADAARKNLPWVVFPAIAGSFTLFESWLRHEVAANPLRTERISISFNYHWV